MDKFLTEEGRDLIITLLVLGAMAVCVLFWIAHKMAEADKLLNWDETDTDPQPMGFRPDAEYVKSVLAELGLNKSLPTYRSTEGAAQARTPEQLSAYNKHLADEARLPSSAFMLAQLSNSHEAKRLNALQEDGEAMQRRGTSDNLRGLLP